LPAPARALRPRRAQLRPRPCARAVAGPALCLLPLALARRGLGPAAALACLTGAVASASLCYAGFHPYVLVRALPQCAVKLRL
jgi:hypothetical protein